jgi:alpha-1,2-mannosyltransferase
MLDTERIGGTAFYANQSLLGTLTRLGLDRAVWFAVAGMVGVAGLWVAAAWHRAGNALAAATAVGLTSLLVSPISWQHHAIWILPALALLLGMRTRWADRVAAVCLAIEFLRLPSWADTWSVDGLVLSMVHGVFVNAGVICYALLLGTLAWAAPRKERLGLGDEVALVGSGR